MKTPSILDSAKKLVEAVEADIRSTEPTSRERRRNAYVLYGRAARASRGRPLDGWDLLGRLHRLFADDPHRGEDFHLTMIEVLKAELDELSKLVEAKPKPTLAICQLRDDIESLFVFSLARELDMCLDLDEEVAFVEELDHTLDQPGFLPDLNRVEFASVDPIDVSKDIGWLAAISSWPVGNPWWVELVRLALADHWACLAADHPEAAEALSLLPRFPLEAREGWSDITRRIIERASPGPTSWPSNEELIKELKNSI